MSIERGILIDFIEKVKMGISEKIQKLQKCKFYMCQKRCKINKHQMGQKNKSKKSCIFVKNIIEYKSIVNKNVKNVTIKN